MPDLDALLPPTPPLTPEKGGATARSLWSESPDESAAAAPAGIPWTRTQAESRASASPPLAAESFAVRSRRLLHEARLLSSTPRLVDLSQPLETRPTTGDPSCPVLVPLGGPLPGTGLVSATVRSRRRDARSQLWAEKERTRRLERKVALLRAEATSAGTGAPEPGTGVSRRSHGHRGTVSTAGVVGPQS